MEEKWYIYYNGNDVIGYGETVEDARKAARDMGWKGSTDNLKISQVLLEDLMVLEKNGEEWDMSYLVYDRKEGAYTLVRETRYAVKMLFPTKVEVDVFEQGVSRVQALNRARRLWKDCFVENENMKFLLGTGTYYPSIDYFPALDEENSDYHFDLVADGNFYTRTAFEEALESYRDDSEVRWSDARDIYDILARHNVFDCSPSVREDIIDIVYDLYKQRMAF